jgi:hypothetical protein
MNTTIQVDVETKRMLEQIKRVHNIDTYDAAIQHLANRKRQSMYGFLADGKNYTMKEISAMVRDKHDRF